MTDYFKKYYPIIIISFLVACLILYWVFYKLAGCSLLYANPGLFGDFVGGVIGTVLTAIAAIFVYGTYETQREQLKVQNSEFELQKKEANQTLVDNLYDRIVKDVEDLEVTFDKNKHFEKRDPEFITYKGVFVLYNLTDLININNTALNQLNLILISCEHLFNLTNSATYKWALQKDINNDRNFLMFYTKILWPIHQFYLQGWDKLITELKPQHPDSLGTRTRFEKLLKTTYKYLLDKQLVGMPVDIAYLKIINGS
jgi:hypothetical protein